MTHLGNSAFSHTALTEITVPKNVSTMYNYVFSNCKYLTSAVIDGTRWLPSNAFSNCSSLKTVTLSDSIKNIGEEPFSGCKLLNSINYLGTKDQAMQLARQRYVCWYADSSIKRIICPDGVVEL